MNYLNMLEHSFLIEKERPGCPPRSRLEFLGQSIFDFTTYDSEIDELFALKMVEVCKAINDRTTFDYIKNKDNYLWFLIMCNMPFFKGKLGWGTSIRGAWWDCYPAKKFKLENCNLWVGEEQFIEMEFEDEEWEEFIAGVVAFVSDEIASKKVKSNLEIK